jgi:hypothetical protein
MINTRVHTGKPPLGISLINRGLLELEAAKHA